MNYSRRQLYALGEPLGDAATYKAGGKVIYGGGGGSSGPTQQTITQSNIPDWLRPQVETVLGGAMQEMFRFPRDAQGKMIPNAEGKFEPEGVKAYVPYSANPADYVAGFSPMQQQAMGSAANLQMPGQFGAASQMAGMAGYGGLGTAGMAQNYAAQQAGAGGRYEQAATSPQAMQNYMSPFMQNVVDVQQQAAQRQADIANQAAKAQFSRGAFGGGSQAIRQAQAAADLARQKQAIQAQGLQSAFQNAQQAQQFGANLGLQGLAGAQQGLQTSLGGYGLLGQQAGTLGDLGTRELAARQGIIGTQSQMGGMEQQQQQNIINQAIQNYAQAQQYPLQQFNAYNALLRGYAVPGQTATSYQAAPSLASQAAGLGMGAYGVSQLVKKKGGAIKAMAEGGISEIDDKVRNNPTKYSEAQIKRSVANEVLDPQTAAMALAEIARARKAAAGINMLQSGLPAQGFAPGGIVAFDDGGRVQRFQVGGQPTTPFGRFVSDYASDFSKKQEENRLRDALRQQYGPVAAPVGFFAPLTDEERAAAKRLMDALPNMSVEQMRRLAAFNKEPTAGVRPVSREGLAAIPGVLNLEPSPAQAEAATPVLTGSPIAGPMAAASAAPPVDPSAEVTAPPPRAGGLAGLSTPMSPQAILEMAQGAGRAAVPAGLSGAGLSPLSPVRFRALSDAAMPGGEAAYTTPLTPLQEALAKESREAAAASREESKGIAERLDKMRASQEARYTAKAKDLETDRNRSVGIAFLEAAQAMTQPGQTFFQGLTRSAAAGGKRLMEDKERLDAKADKLTEALERLDEARLGDQRERNAAETQYRNALLGVRKEMVNNAVTAYGMNRADARDFVKMSVARDEQIANLDLQRRIAEINAEQGAVRNAIAAVQAANAGRNPQLEVLQAGARDPEIARLIKNNPQLELIEAAIKDPRIAPFVLKDEKGFSEFTEYLKANPQIALMPLPKQLEAFMLAKQMVRPTVYTSETRPANAIPYTPPAR